MLEVCRRHESFGRDEWPAGARECRQRFRDRIILRRARGLSIFSAAEERGCGPGSAGALARDFVAGSWGFFGGAAHRLSRVAAKMWVPSASALSYDGEHATAHQALKVRRRCIRLILLRVPAAGAGSFHFGRVVIAPEAKLTSIQQCKPRHHVLNGKMSGHLSMCDDAAHRFACTGGRHCFNLKPGFKGPCLLRKKLDGIRVAGLDWRGRPGHVLELLWGCATFVTRSQSYRQSGRICRSGC